MRSIIAAIIEKTSWGFTTVVLFLAGRLSAQMLGAGALDLLLGVLFVVAYVRTASASLS